MLLNDTCVKSCPSTHVPKEGKCVPDCPESTYFTDGKCQKCADPDCLSCTSPSKCSVCKPGTDCILSCLGLYDYKHNKCVDKCEGLNSYFSLTPAAGLRTPRCEYCDSKCLKCQESESTIRPVCVKCPENLYAFGQKCIDRCPYGYYDDSEGVCQKCENGCQVCVSKYLCLDQTPEKLR